MTDREPPDQERGEDERTDAEPRDWRRPRIDTSHLDETLRSLPDDPVPPMPHLRPISGMTAAWDRPPAERTEQTEPDAHTGPADEDAGADAGGDTERGATPGLTEQPETVEQAALPWTAPDERDPATTDAAARTEPDLGEVEVEADDGASPSELGAAGERGESPDETRTSERLTGISSPPPIEGNLPDASATTPESRVDPFVDEGSGTPTSASTVSDDAEIEEIESPDTGTEHEAESVAESRPPASPAPVTDPESQENADDTSIEDAALPAAPLDQPAASPGDTEHAEPAPGAHQPVEQSASEEATSSAGDLAPAGWRSRLFGRRRSAGAPVAASTTTVDADSVATAENTQPITAADTESPAEPEPEPETPALPRRAAGIPLNAYGVILVAIATSVALAFLLIEPAPRWMLLVGTGAVIFGMDGVLRATWREPFASGEPTTPYLFLPALYMLGAPVIVQENIPMPWLIAIGLGVGLGFALIMLAELVTARPASPYYPGARIIATSGAYFTLFAIASMTYVFDASLTWSLIAMAMLGIMLGIEVLREGEIDPLETLVFSVVVGFVLLQARWVLHYLALDTYMAGLTLTLIFFFTTGLLHAHVTRRFELGVVVEYTGIAAAGLALVVAARATGLA